MDVRNEDPSLAILSKAGFSFPIVGLSAAPTSNNIADVDAFESKLLNSCSKKLARLSCERSPRYLFCFAGALPNEHDAPRLPLAENESALFYDALHSEIASFALGPLLPKLWEALVEVGFIVEVVGQDPFLRSQGPAPIP